MAEFNTLREGMQVYDTSDQMLGIVERADDTGFEVAGRRYARESIGRVAQGRVYLRADAAVAGTARAADRQDEGQLRIPVAEERLTVGKREVELGEVAIRKTVTEEEQTIPVTLTHEEVRVEEIDTPDRPATGADLFAEETIRVPVRGEEAVVAKEAVVTGEVVIDKEAVAEQQQVSGTVRRQRVEVDRAYQEARADLEQAHATGGTGRTFAQAEPEYRVGFTAAHDERHAGREFEDVETDLRREYEADTARGGDWARSRGEIQTGWTQARERARGHHRLLTQVQEGMDVYDRDGEKIGTVRDVYMGNSTPRGRVFGGTSGVMADRDDSFLDNLAEAFVGDDTLPETFRNRLVRQGYVRIDAAGFFAKDRFATPDQLAAVSEGRVELSVMKDELISA